MNFFGHAVAASWQRSDPRFVLGAMLPDFATMCGTRLLEVADPTVAAGIDHHHQIDRVFHALPVVRELMRTTSAALRQAGIGRGPAAGAGHVGVELLLDGVLIESAEHRSIYRAGIDGAASDIDDSLTWEPGGAGRWQELRERLCSLGPPTGYADPEEVAHRLERILAPRPRLRLSPGSVPVLARVLQDLRPAITAATPAVLGALKETSP